MVVKTEPRTLGPVTRRVMIAGSQVESNAMSQNSFSEVLMKRGEIVEFLPDKCIQVISSVPHGFNGDFFVLCSNGSIFMGIAKANNDDFRWVCIEPPFPHVLGAANDLE